MIYRSFLSLTTLDSVSKYFYGTWKRWQNSPPDVGGINCRLCLWSAERPSSLWKNDGWHIKRHTVCKWIFQWLGSVVKDHGRAHRASKIHLDIIGNQKLHLTIAKCASVKSEVNLLVCIFFVNGIWVNSEKSNSLKKALLTRRYFTKRLLWLAG